MTPEDMRQNPTVEASPCRDRNPLCEIHIRAHGNAALKAILAVFLVAGSLAPMVACSNSESGTEQHKPRGTVSSSAAATGQILCQASGYTFENTRGTTPCEVMTEAWINYRLDSPTGGPRTVTLENGTTAFCTDTTRAVGGVKGTCEYNGSEFRARL